MPPKKFRREVLRVEELTEADIAAIEAAKVPDEFEYLNSEMDLMVDESED